MKKKQGNQKRGCGGKKNSVQELLSIQYLQLAPLPNRLEMARPYKCDIADCKNNPAYKEKKNDE